ncbi:SPOR domain-containing protein [Fulvimonas sp. R45]|uniref:SPOR domain-containing protein n=1 Tax=Fulvimonas sp. R45 TaxID=3045937 RepID=UPI00265FFC42|nr:SPOR domain-containing protein [Fulvimonas sp. R45]MDO1529720.1 SPOR domain-containing protein [Fulvimonas sp. R45]
MNTRLLGAAVLIALAVLFVPMFFSSKPPAAGADQSSVSLAIPPAPDSDLQTKTMSLVPGGAASASAPAAATSSGTPGHPVIPLESATGTTTTPGAGSQLATVNIASNRPRDVGTDAAAPGRAQGATPPAPAAAAPAQPVAKSPTPAPVQPAPAPAPATAARGHFTLNLSAYSASGAQRLIERVKALGYPAGGHAIQRAGQSLTLVSAGPFDTRAAAEAARLKILQSIPGAPVHLESGASTPDGDAPSPAPAAAGHARAGGWAVQVAAMGSQADANALRDKLRAAGFDGFVDSVNAGGKRLWRVRAGPQTQRADAVRVRDQIKAKLGLAGNVVGVP